MLSSFSPSRLLAGLKPQMFLPPRGGLLPMLHRPSKYVHDVLERAPRRRRILEARRHSLLFHSLRVKLRCRVVSPHGRRGGCRAWARRWRWSAGHLRAKGVHPPDHRAWKDYRVCWDLVDCLMLQFLHCVCERTWSREERNVCGARCGEIFIQRAQQNSPFETQQLPASSFYVNSRVITDRASTPLLSQSLSFTPPSRDALIAMSEPILFEDRCNVSAVNSQKYDRVSRITAESGDRHIFFNV